MFANLGFADENPNPASRFAFKCAMQGFGARIVRLSCFARAR